MIAALLLLIAPPPTADKVLVVINQSSALSRSAGEYYARKRAVPAENVCSIRTAAVETVSRNVYDREIEPAIATCLKARAQAERILYIALMAGVPLRIQGTQGLDGDCASVDSELTLLYAKMKGAKFPLKGFVPNPFSGKVNSVFSHPEFPIYLVTRLAAYDFAGIRALVERSVAARNYGNFVIDLRGDDSPGDQWLRDAAIRLPTARTVFDDSARVLQGLTGVIGYASWGSNDKERKQRRLGFQWLPGAIVSEFVSTNARTFRRPPEAWNISRSWDKKELLFEGSPQTLIADYLDEGATGAAGHVFEPFLGLNPRPDRLFPAYYSGRNLAESFYLALPGLSWQNIVVGDPLCRLGPPPGTK